MVEPYYNNSAGLGYEGFLNYANILTEGWFVNAFLALIWFVTVYVLTEKAQWKLPASSAFGFFIIFITAMIFKLFTQVNELVMFIIIIGMAGSIFWAIITERT